MRYGRLLFRMTAAGIALCCLPAFTQQPIVSRNTDHGLEGRLTVTATVVTSVGLVVDPNGRQRIVIANAADPKDNVSRLQPWPAVNPIPIADGDKKLEQKDKKAGTGTSSIPHRFTITGDMSSRTEPESPSWAAIRFVRR